MSSQDQIPTTFPGVADTICPRFAGFRVVPGCLSAQLRTGFTLLELVVVMVIIAALACLVVPNLDKTVDEAEMEVARLNMKTIHEAIMGSAAAPGLLADMKLVPGFEPLEDFKYLHDLLIRAPGYPEYDLTLKRGWRGPYLKGFSGGLNTNSLCQGLFPFAEDRRRGGDSTFSERFFYDLIGTSYVSRYGEAGVHRIIADPWGNPIILQVPPDDAFLTPTDAERWYFARLVSAGPDGILSTPHFDVSNLVPEVARTEARLAGLLSDGTKPARGDDIVLFLNRLDIYEEEQP